MYIIILSKYSNTKRHLIRTIWMDGRTDGQFCKRHYSTEIYIHLSTIIIQKGKVRVKQMGIKRSKETKTINVHLCKLHIHDYLFMKDVSYLLRRKKNYKDLMLEQCCYIILYISRDVYLHTHLQRCFNTTVVAL